MKNETAIEVLTGELGREFEYTQGFRNMYIGALELALESLEKQTPTMVADKWEIGIHVNGECSICGEIMRRTDTYCRNCGQLNKWG